MSTALPNPDDKLKNWVAERDLRDTMEHERRERFVTEKYRGAFLIMTLVAVLQITVLVVVAKGLPFAGAASTANTLQAAESAAKASLPRIADADRQMTLEEFGALQSGISYDEARRALGADGQELARCRFDGETGIVEPLETVVYAWINADGSSVNATFQNGKLLSASQSGLR